MIYILWGEDEFSLEEKLLEIKKSLGDMSLLSTNTNILDGQKLSSKELEAVGGAMPFLSANRLVIIKGLLGRFEPRDKFAKAKKSNGHSTKKDEPQILADCIKAFPESTVTILIDIIEVRNSSLKSNPLFNALADKAQVIPFPVLKNIKLTQWIQARVTRQGGSVSRQATDLLVQIIGGDLHTMVNEINKLVAFTSGRLIEEKDVRLIVSAAQEADVFVLVDAIMDHKTGLAEQMLQKLLQRGTVPSQILALLARQIQVMIQLKDLKSLKRSTSDIQSKLGIYNPYTWNKVSTRAEKYAMEKLKAIYRSLLATDLEIKTGKFDGDLALNILVAELSESQNINSSRIIV